MTVGSNPTRLRPPSGVRLLGASLACLVALSLARPASAALGDTTASIARDRIAMRGNQSSTTPMQSYDVHRMVDPAGGVVREYADRAGTVFAVTWHGPRSPDLKTLLGGYYDRYVGAAAQHRPGQDVVTVHAPDLVLSVVRFQRVAYGRAYLPKRMPSGVTKADLR